MYPGVTTRDAVRTVRVVAVQLTGCRRHTTHGSLSLTSRGARDPVPESTFGALSEAELREFRRHTHPPDLNIGHSPHFSLVHSFVSDCTLRPRSARHLAKDFAGLRLVFSPRSSADVSSHVFHILPARTRCPQHHHHQFERTLCRVSIKSSFRLRGEFRQVLGDLYLTESYDHSHEALLRSGGRDESDSREMY